MANVKSVRMNVNGETVEAVIPVRLNLVDFLRHHVGMTGSHVGCEHGVCGACTIEVDGRAVRGCLMFAVQADGSSVTTVEGLAQSGRSAALAAAFKSHNAVQCGFCTPGMMMSALSYIELAEARTASRYARIFRGITAAAGYQAIIDTIEEVIREKQAMNEDFITSTGQFCIGKSVPRPDIDRLVAGRGRFVDDLSLPRMLHAFFARRMRMPTFCRSTLRPRDARRESRLYGCRYSGAYDTLYRRADASCRSSLEERYPLAVGRVRWQGEPVVMVVAGTRAKTEDAIEVIAVEYAVRR